MRYLGGKSRIAKEIAAIVAPKGLWWEPFCGGLSVSVQLAKYGPGLVSDASPALISLYQAVRDGWQPPESLSPAQYDGAKLLPDGEPLKAFAGFGCSFGGKWFAGYAKGGGRNHCGESARTLAKDVAGIASASLAHCSFFERQPQPGEFEAIYCDPPYEGTTGYKGVAAFDSAAFWARCQEWASAGARVYVSEYACPVPHEGVWEKPLRVSAGQSHQRAMAVERLFRVLPA